MRIFWGILVVSCFAVSAFGQSTAVRKLSEYGYIPGGPVYVEIEISNKTEDISVIETPPVGWEVTAMPGRYTGEISNGNITWNLSQGPTQKNLSYVVLPPETASEDVTFKGNASGNDISGDQILIYRDPKPVGIFEDHLDNREYSPAGNADYLDEEYIVEAGSPSGGLHNCFSVMDGSFSIEGMVRATGTGKPIAIAYFTIFMPDNNQGTSVPYFLLGRNSRGGLWYAYTSSYGGSYNLLFPDTEGSQGQKIKLERIGSEFLSYHMHAETGEWTKFNTTSLPWAETDPLYVGIGSTPQGGGRSEGHFTEIELKQLSDPSCVENWGLYE